MDPANQMATSTTKAGLLYKKNINCNRKLEISTAPTKA